MDLGISSLMDVRIVYLDIMRPFAESVLQGWVYPEPQYVSVFIIASVQSQIYLAYRNINRGPAVNDQWIYDTPVHSDVEANLRKLLVELGNNEKILGIQVCNII